MDVWQHAQQLFDAALQHPPERRQEFLEQARGSNQELRREVESLLAAHDESGSFMREPALAGMADVLHEATSRFRPGDTLGVYKVLAWVGSGGMGEVYRAQDTRLKREVAIKVLPQAFAADRERLRRFEQEARAAAALNHPNIVSVHDMGTAEGSPYIVAELLEGQNLGDLLRQGPVSARKALDYAMQAARGLAAAHDAHIIHRDLKPENLFITKDGQVKILDFGLAKLTRADAFGTESGSGETGPQTEAGSVFGTIGYMSPEQVRGQAADHRSDIFSFGCILYELFSGHRAFSGESRADTLSAILHQEPPELTRATPPVHPAIDRTIRHCLEKNPIDRFQSAHDLVFQLETATEGVSAAARRWPAAAAMVVATVAIAGGGWWVVTHQPRAAPVAAAKPADDPRRLLAVLPFENITRDGKPGYFGAGMTEEVTGQLSKLSALRVVGRAVVAKFKDVRSDLAVMVQELGIGSVVTGTVREDGPRLRVNVELMDARSGQVIWSEQYDREATDVFAVQSDIALRVADALQASVTLDEQARMGK